MSRKPVNNIRDSRLKVQQHHAAGSTPSELVARYSRGPTAGRIPQDPAASLQPQFSSLPSDHYHDMMNKVADIKSRFAALPARDRSVFQNEPYQWLRFCENPTNREVCLKRGWATLSDAELSAQAQKVEDERLKRVLEGVKPVLTAKSDSEAQPQHTPPQGGKGG